MVLMPLLLSCMLWIGVLLTRLPLEALPLMASWEKSYSQTSLLSFRRGLRRILTVSASPLWLTVNQSMAEPGVPIVMSYSLSLVTEVTAKRLA